MNISKRYRKAAALLAALTALCLALSACGAVQKAVEKAVENAVDEAAQKAAESIKEQAKDIVQQAAGTGGTQAAPAQDGKKEDEAPKPEYKVEGQVMAEDDSFRITFDKVEESWLGGVDFSLLCENMDPEKTLRFYISDTAVNGYMVSSLFVGDVAPGKRSFEELSLSSTDMERAGISSVDKLELSLRVSDANDIMAKPFMEERLCFYPTGMSDDDIVIPERKNAGSELFIEENDNFCFAVIGTRDDSIRGYMLDCWLYNKSGADLMFTWDEVSVNGFMIDPFWATTVAAGCRSFDAISFSDSKLEESHIEKPEEIEFKLRVYDVAHIMSKDAYSKVFTLTLE